MRARAKWACAVRFEGDDQRTSGPPDFGKCLWRKGVEHTCCNCDDEEGDVISASEERLYDLDRWC